MKNKFFLIGFLISILAWAQEPKLPTDPTDPNYEKDLQTYIDYQMKGSKNANKEETHEEDDDAEVKALKAKIIKACAEDVESVECQKYRKAHSELMKFGLENLDTIIEHGEKKGKKTQPKK